MQQQYFIAKNSLICFLCTAAISRKTTFIIGAGLAGLLAVAHNTIRQFDTRYVASIKNNTATKPAALCHF